VKDDQQFPQPVGGPLAGLRVIEVGRYIAAPYAGRLLADMGADVVKVEDPDGGDPMRRWQGGQRSYSPQFAAYNRGKRSVTINLKEPDGRSALRALARRADVLLENFRPGVMDRLGLGSAVLRADNPKLIYCALTGFGTTGPYANRPSYDTVISAMGGLYSLMRPADQPSPVGPAMSDLLSGMFAVQGVLAALHSREVTGHGDTVEVSMLGSILGFVTEAVTSTLETGESPDPDTRQRRAQAFGAVAADGKAFIVHMSVPEKFWIAFTDAMDHPEWRIDPRFARRVDRYQHYAELDALFKTAALDLPRAEWMRRFLERDLPHGPLNTVSDIIGDPQVEAMGLIEQVPVPDGPPMAMTRPPVGFSGHRMAPGRSAPELGADTAALLDTALDAAQEDHSWRN
jgi:crotonobetainyl-CoA:carnitine CoA-transferase CaiB-like acyl-CoA transferase